MQELRYSKLWKKDPRARNGTSLLDVSVDFIFLLDI